jgi:hypothetical protein
VLLEYGRPQGVLRRADVLGKPDHNPAGPLTSKVKLARKAHTDEKMEVDGNEHRPSSDVEALDAQGPPADARNPRDLPLRLRLQYSQCWHTLSGRRMTGQINMLPYC